MIQASLVELYLKIKIVAAKKKLLHLCFFSTMILWLVDSYVWISQTFLTSEMPQLGNIQSFTKITSPLLRGQPKSYLDSSCRRRLPSQTPFVSRLWDIGDQIRRPKSTRLPSSHPLSSRMPCGTPCEQIWVQNHQETIQFQTKHATCPWAMVPSKMFMWGA